MKTIPTFNRFGKHAVLLAWEAVISEEIQNDVLKWDRFIRENFTEQLIETVPAYQSLALYLKPKISVEDLIEQLQKTDVSSEGKIHRTTHIFTIPVCYEKEHAPDIQEVATQHQLTVSEVIKLHTQPKYTIQFLGFLPGFPYLSGLIDKLHTPRKTKPSALIPQGSVGIGGKQTGIYTQESPGGWNIIGTCPLQFFNPNVAPPVWFRAGDRIQFEAISKAEFATLRELVTNENYKVQREVYND